MHKFGNNCLLNVGQIRLDKMPGCPRNDVIFAHAPLKMCLSPGTGVWLQLERGKYRQVWMGWVNLIMWAVAEKILELLFWYERYVKSK